MGGGCSCRTAGKGSIAWATFWGYSAVILCAAFLSADDLPDILEDLNDKLLHLAAYAVLFVAGWNAFRQSRRPFLHARPLFFAFLWCVCLGAITEWVQLGAQSRNADVFDFLADAAGGLLAWLVFRFFLKRPMPEVRS